MSDGVGGSRLSCLLLTRRRAESSIRLVCRAVADLSRHAKGSLFIVTQSGLDLSKTSGLFRTYHVKPSYLAAAGERNRRQSARKIRIIATSKTTAPTPRRIRMRFWFISTYTPRLA